MEIISIVLIFLALITVLVFIHELGHYLVARFYNVRVHVFSVGFGPRLFGFHDKNGTDWRFSLVPIGGYVKMAGEHDDEADTTPDEERFDKKSPWRRLAIVLAGPIANFILAFFIYIGVFWANGIITLPAVIDRIVADTPAASVDLQPNDRVLAINGETVSGLRELVMALQINGDAPVTLTIMRGNTEIKRTLTAVNRGRGVGYQIGVIFKNKPHHKKLGPIDASLEGFSKVATDISGTLTAIKNMIIGQLGTENIGGPIMIAQISAQAASIGMLALLMFAGMISVNLGLINLFPVPGLDGGHAVLFILEGIRGKPLQEKTMSVLSRIGLFLILFLMIFAISNDIIHF